MKNKCSTTLLCLLFFAGLSLLLYPTLSDYWNSLHASKAIAAYSAEVSQLTDTQTGAIRAAAEEYNRSLAAQGSRFSLTDEQRMLYASQLNLDGTGVMGYMEIPAIDVSLPIYHGTDDSVLQVAVGHLEWSSLPVGGAGSHCVLSGHRGLPSAKLFTNLDQLVLGDTFVLRVLDEVLTYEVDQILTVEPEDLSALGIEAGQDLCTLVTCTPYGINTHRLLVRGHRVENQASSESVRVTSDAIQIEPLIVAPLAALPMLLILLLLLLLPKRSGSSREGRKNDEKDS